MSDGRSCSVPSCTRHLTSSVLHRPLSDLHQNGKHECNFVKFSTTMASEASAFFSTSRTNAQKYYNESSLLRIVLMEICEDKFVLTDILVLYTSLENLLKLVEI